MTEPVLSRRTLLSAAITGTTVSVAGCTETNFDTDARPDARPPIQSVQLVIEQASGEYHDASLFVRFPKDTRDVQLRPEYLRELFTEPDHASVSIPDRPYTEYEDQRAVDINIEKLVPVQPGGALETVVPDSPLTTLEIPELPATSLANWSDTVGVSVLFTPSNNGGVDLRRGRMFGGSCTDDGESCYLQYIDNGKKAYNGDYWEPRHLGSGDREFRPPDSRDTFTEDPAEMFSEGIPQFTYLAGEPLTTLEELATTKNTLASEARVLFDPKRSLAEFEAEVVEKIAETLSVIASSGVATPVSTATRSATVVSLAGDSAEKLLSVGAHNRLAETERLERLFNEATTLGIFNSNLTRYLVRRPATSYDGNADEYNYYRDKSPSLGQIERLAVMERFDYLPLIRTAQSMDEQREIIASYFECVDEELGAIRAMTDFVKDYNPTSQGEEIIVLEMQQYARSVLRYLEAYTEVAYAWAWHALDALGDTPDDTRDLIN